MWTRSLLKTHAREFLQRNYWRTVLASLVLTLCLGGGFAVSYNTSFKSSVKSVRNAAKAVDTYDFRNFLDAAFESIGLSGFDRRMLLGIITTIAIIVLIGALIGFALRIFLFQPLEVGCRRFFLDNHNKPATLGSIGFSFENGRYWNIVKTQLLKEVFIFLWGLLFIIPGIVKSYSYRLVPFILADDPEISPNDAILLSRQLMNGNKWKAFVLDLSFILWHLLNIFTFRILGIFWVSPYVYCTDAELYLVLRYSIANPLHENSVRPQPEVQPQPQAQPQPETQPQPEVQPQSQAQPQSGETVLTEEASEEAGTEVVEDRSSNDN